MPLKALEIHLTALRMDTFFTNYPETETDAYLQPFAEQIFVSIFYNFSSHLDPFVEYR